MPLLALHVWLLAELCRCLLDLVLSLLAVVSLLALPVWLLAELLLALRVWLLA
jgi:hypothetical protein